MIVHIVFFKLKNYPVGLTEMEKNLAELKTKIPGIEEFQVGIDFSRQDRSYDLALYSTFNTKDDLNHYAVSDAHLAFIDAYTKKYCDHTKVVDFEI